jgi:tape measure domain-containing protein
MPDFAVVTAFRATDKMSPAFNKMGAAADRFGTRASRSAGIVNSAFSAIIPALGIAGILMIGNAIKDAAKQASALETSFRSVFQSDAANQMRFVREESHRLGLDFVMAADAYKGIAAAAKGTAISNFDVQQTFLGVSEAATALQLTSEQSQGALLAISQIISKGKVSMEELRGQLGERIPGAMQIAARSMGVTTAELEKLVARGIPAEKFIPRFAAQMRKEFGPAAADAATKFAASEQRFKNLMFSMKAGLGTALLPALNDIMMALTPLIAAFASWADANRDTISAIIQKLVPALAIAVGLFVAYKVALMGIAIAQAVVTGIGWIKYLAQMLPLMRSVIAAHGLFNFVLGGTAFWQAVVAAKTALVTAAQWSLNFAISACPIVFVFMAAAAWLVYLNTHIEEMIDLFYRLTRVLDNPIIKGLLTGVLGAGAMDLVSATRQKIEERRNELAAPNAAREGSRGVQFEGQLNINNAPPGSTASSKTKGAPNIPMHLVGVM